MIDHRWLAAEASFGRLPGQAFWLFRRGLARPLYVAVACAALAAVLVGSILLAHRTYEPRVVLRVVEADRDPTSAPELKRRLAEYVRDGVFTAEPLLELAHRYGLYSKIRDRRALLDAFRRDIDVDVYQNYFVEQRESGQAPRSARVAISYRAGDRAAALAVTRDLGALVVARVTASREEQARRAAANAQSAASTLEQALTDRYRDAADTRARLGATPDPTLQVKLVGLLGSLPGLERQVEGAEQRAGLLDLGAAYESHGIGLRFDVADDASAPLFDRHSSLRLLGMVVAFVIGVPLAVLAVGAATYTRGTS
ncbi:MAG TPA: hypothetical protein VGQ57_19495 [Polyangiaceae bacterium]|nr:hypothetical protein [Polyangiaceae bacterium]